MTSGSYIQGKQQAWARRKGIPLQGSKGKHGAHNYTLSVEANFFGGGLLPAVRESFESGAGGELRGTIPTMAALHSSAAMAVNLFQYWIGLGDLTAPARLLDVPSTKLAQGTFEGCFPVCEAPAARGFREPPHLDFALRYSNGGRVGVECKLFEPYGRLDHQPLSNRYLRVREAWNDIPVCRALAEQLTTGDAGYHRLGPSQLLKHILGLKFGVAPHQWRLVYLYLDAPGDEAGEHRNEVERFQKAVAPDGIPFVPLSVQEFILRAVSRLRLEHQEYVDYLAERYL